MGGTADPMTPEGYWRAYEDGDRATVAAVNRAVAARLRAEADELERREQWVDATHKRLEATQIEDGSLAAFPRPEEPRDG
jgi:hypothetical protein